MPILIPNTFLTFPKPLKLLIPIHAPRQPPGVQTALTPGQETRAGYMPLDAFIDEAMQLLGQQPTPSEILVEKVRPLRSADGEGRVEQMAAAIYAAARGGRQD